MSEQSARILRPKTRSCHKVVVDERNFLLSNFRVRAVSAIHGPRTPVIIIRAAQGGEVFVSIAVFGVLVDLRGQRFCVQCLEVWFEAALREPDTIL